MPSRRPPERPVVGPAAPDVAPSRPVPGSCQRALVRRSPLILAAVVLLVSAAVLAVETPSGVTGSTGDIAILEGERKAGTTSESAAVENAAVDAMAQRDA